MKKILISYCLATLMVCMFHTSYAKTIDQSNAQEVEGKIPDMALDLVKSGDLIMILGELDYDTSEYFLPWTKDSMKDNVGKYALNSQNEIINRDTEELANYIIGYPFPAIEESDEKAAVKIAYNGRYTSRQAGGGFAKNFEFQLIGRGGLERVMKADAYSMFMDGHPYMAGFPNPDGISLKKQIIVTHPYDLAGFSSMTWRYYDAEKEDLTFSYIPALRRVRRMSPASRSDASMGSDLTADDGGQLGYEGKIPDFTWKLIGKKNILVEYIQPEPHIGYINDLGEFVREFNEKNYITLGYESEEWKGAPWFSPSTIWVERPAWILELRSKNPYYNFGKEILYVDAEFFVGLWKEIYGKSDEPWKIMNQAWMHTRSRNDKRRWITDAGMRMVDIRADHATYTDYLTPETTYVIEKRLDPDQFTLSGFTALCK